MLIEGWDLIVENQVYKMRNLCIERGDKEEDAFELAVEYAKKVLKTEEKQDEEEIRKVLKRVIENIEAIERVEK